MRLIRSHFTLPDGMAQNIQKWTSSFSEWRKFLKWRAFFKNCLLVLEVIGNTHGAQEVFFNRFENRVTALPPKGNLKITEVELDYRGFPLRLYCLALNDELVILFNGGIKNAQTVQESADVITMKFYEANEFAKRILNAINTGEILINGRVITNYNGQTDIYL